MTIENQYIESNQPPNTYQRTIVRRSTLFLFFVAAMPMFALADCPSGQFPGHDAHGNRACVSTLNERVVSLDAGQDVHCAPGYERVLDRMGRYFCVDKQRGLEAKPRRASCPPGQWLKADTWGHERCYPVP